MHYSNLVIIERNTENKDKSIERLVAEAMGPHEDSGGFWDWYQIGGRWTGLFDNYDPTKEPENNEVCWLCHGTGLRNDDIGKAQREADPNYTCNSCGGKGIAVKWPTQFKNYPGDIIPISQLTEEHLKRFYRVVTPYGAFANERWLPWHKANEVAFQKLEMPTLEWIKEEFENGKYGQGEFFAVVVDNHC